MTPTNSRELERRLRAVLPAAETEAGTGSNRSLGEPLDLRDVAALIGCSAWTVRQTLMPKGLPCFRTGPSGKLIFYRDQVIRWIEHRQRHEGGVT